MDKLTFYTGRERQDGKREDFEARQALELYLAETFGGYTRIDTNGGWIDPDTGKLYQERGFKYEVFRAPYGRPVACDMANKIKDAFDQLCVLYIVEFEDGSREDGRV